MSAEQLLPASRGHVVTAPPLEPGLYIVATPIGNLGDITLRALETLAACRYPRLRGHPRHPPLLDRYGIRARARRLSRAQRRRRRAQADRRAEDGQSVALVSDAGTPLVSDPGYRLVAEARQAGHPRDPDSRRLGAARRRSRASGMPSDDFLLRRFPAGQGRRAPHPACRAGASPSTLIAFESPARLRSTLDAVADVFGPDRPAPSAAN